MTKRNENVRQAVQNIEMLLDWHSDMLKHNLLSTGIKLQNDKFFKDKIKSLLYSIKRTTWRGDKLFRITTKERNLIKKFKESIVDDVQPKPNVSY